MTRTRKILITAQSFGFGPSAKACAIAVYLKKLTSNNIEVDFVGNSVALDFSLLNREAYNQIIKINQSSDFKDVLVENDYDYVLSVMEPHAIVTAKMLGYCASSIDSLFWFWDWPQQERTHIKEALKKLPRSIEDAYSLLDSIHPHLQQYVAHSLSDHVFVQCYPLSDTRSDLEFSNDHRVKIVGPIIDDRFIKQGTSRNNLVVSFCGQINPLVTTEDVLLYCEFCIDLLREGICSFLEMSPGSKVLFLCNKQVVESVEQILQKKGIPNSTCSYLSHEEYLKTISESIAVIAPASITTLFEAHVYERPVVLLPEQHDGHWPNFSRISALGDTDAFPNVMLTQFFQDLGELTEAKVSSIYSVIQHLQSLNGRESRDKMASVYSQLLPKLTVAEEARSLFLKQQQSMASLDTFSTRGAEMISQRVLAELSR